MSNSFPKNCAKRKSSRGKRGVALVFTLGILGLLAVLALGFASTALLNRKISENTSNTVYAQNLARSIALARVMYGVEKGLDLSKLYSYSTDTNSSYKDWLYKLETYLNGTRIFKYEPTSNVRWQYIKDSDKIVGRFAYVVVQDKGRLDPSVNVNDITSSIGITGFSEKEVGINESTWSDSLKVTTGSPVFRWATFGEIFKMLSLLVPPITDDQKRDFFKEGRNVGQLKSPEAYWADSNSNGKKDSEEFYLRFNLYRTDWNSMTAKKLVGEEPSGTTAIPFSGTSATSIDFIPWLNEWNEKYKTDSNKKKAAMAKQVAANIIQYNRDKDQPTESDQTGNWITESPSPTYAGIGKHPLLNEAGVLFTALGTLNAEPFPNASAPTAYDYTIDYVFTVKYGVELIDMFNEHSATSTITFPNLAITAKYIAPDNNSTFSSWALFEAADKTQTLNFTGGTGRTLTINPSDWSNGYTSSGSFWSSEIELPTLSFQFRINEGIDRSSAIKSLLKIKDVTIAPQKMILTYNGSQRDYAELPIAEDKDATGNFAERDAQPLLQKYYCAIEANDPRVNHFAEDWTIKLPDAGNPHGQVNVTTDSGDHYHGTSGIQNNTTASPIPEEKTGVNDPAYTGSSRLSTSYIRHGQMKSLWELGCISRAEAWKTLNLSRKDIPSPPAPSSPDYSYAKGDATLFDQIKLNETDERMRYGKVNLNTDVANVLQALLDSTKLIYKKDLHNGSGDILLNTGTSDSIQVTDIINSILACTSIYSFQNRADLLIDPENVSYLPGYNETKHSELKTKLTAMQDLLLPPSIPKIEREEVISKIMPLLKTEPYDMLYVVVVAQTIRDIGGTPAFVDFDGDGEFSASDITITGDQKYQKTGYVKKEGASWILVESPPTALKEQISNTTLGIYDIGADKITSEVKLVAVLVQDPITRKWRIARYQYVE